MVVRHLDMLTAIGYIFFPMGNDFLDGVFEKNPAFVARKIGDETVLVPVESDVGDLESVFTLNEVATFIWDLIDGKKKVRAILKKILDEFDVERAKALEDLTQFLHGLEEIEAIRRVK